MHMLFFLKPVVPASPSILVNTKWQHCSNIAIRWLVFWHDCTQTPLLWDNTHVQSKQGTTWQHCYNFANWCSPNGNIVALLPPWALFICWVYSLAQSMQHCNATYYIIRHLSTYMCNWVELTFRYDYVMVVSVHSVSSNQRLCTYMYM